MWVICYEVFPVVAVAIFLRLGVDCPRVIRRVLSRAPPPFTSERRDTLCILSTLHERL